jgi:hypothetical protein
MSRVDRERSQHRKDLLPEHRVQLAQLALGDIGGADERDAGFGKGRDDVAVEQADLTVDQALDPGANDPELLEGRHTVRRGDRHRGQDLFLEPRHPNLEEIVEVLAEDRQEPDPFEDGKLGILRHGQHPLVEIEPGQLPVEVAGGLRRRQRACLIRVWLDSHHHA